MLLQCRLGGGLDEQIAALLHDVSHTVQPRHRLRIHDGHDSQSYHEEQKRGSLPPATAGSSETA
jgi:hypothetical protein